MSSVEENEALARLLASASQLETEVASFKDLLDNKLTPNANVFERFTLLKEVITLTNGELLRTLRKFEEDNQALINNVLDGLGLASLEGETIVTNGVITTAGRARLNTATALNKVNISKIFLGDGGGGFYIVNGNETSLKNKKYEGVCSKPMIDANNPNIVMFDTLVPASSGPYTTREAAIVDSDGNLFALGLTAVVQKPDPATANAKVLAVRVYITLDSPSQAYLFEGASQAGGGSSDVSSHNLLGGRSDPNAHPASAITGLSQLRDEFYGGVIAPAKPEEVATVGSVVPADTDFLRLNVGSKTKVFRFLPKVSGAVTAITLSGDTPSTVTIAGTVCRVYPVGFESVGVWTGVISTESTSADFPFPSMLLFQEGGTIEVKMFSRGVADANALFLNVAIHRNSNGAYSIQELQRVGSEISCDIINVNEYLRVFDTRSGRKQFMVTYKQAVPQLYIYNTQEPPTPIRPTYDTIIGVGDSITQGEYDLGSGIYNNAFRGVTFKTAAQYGTTLANIRDTISNFTSIASGRTLFIVRAGINDCNSLLSAGGVNDGASGTVLAWSDLSQANKDAANSALRSIVASLKAVGDVAISTITYCDAKGQLTALPDKGRNLHSGSWNDALNVPLCEELTPEFWDSINGRPVFDYYNVVYQNPDILDADNLHFYSDWYYTQSEAGYPNPHGSYTLRKYTQDQLAAYTTFRGTPFDPNVFADRILINVGRGTGLAGRPSFQRDSNQFAAETTTASLQNLKSYKGNTNVSITANFPAVLAARANHNTASQPWDEGVGDRNICSSGVISNNSTTPPKVTISGLTGKRGKVRVVGMFVTEGSGSTYDATAKTIFRVEDEVGQVELERSSSINGTTVNIADCIAEFDFDCINTGQFDIVFKKGVGSTYGTLSGIEILINK